MYFAPRTMPPADGSKEPALATIGNWTEAKGAHASTTIDNRNIAVMRLLLATSALLIILVDPSEPERLVSITHISLGLYVTYSAVILFFAWGPGLPMIFSRGAHWIDVGWYGLFVALTGGADSIFFLGFFFPMLAASFLWGFIEGLRVTLISATLFSAVGLVTMPHDPTFELKHFLLRPVYLLVLGYMIAYWGEFELALKGRLSLLKEVTAFSNPRFGVDRTLGLLVARIRDFYNADSCLVIMADPNTGIHRLYRTLASQNRSSELAQGEPVPPDMARLLLALPSSAAIVYSSKSPAWKRWSLQGDYYAFDARTGERTTSGKEASQTLAETLGADSFVSVPLIYRGDGLGRLYFTAPRRTFEPADAHFLLQVAEQVVPVLQNIRLVDRLASDAAEVERQKIARDLHDSVIQPYIGLQMGLASLRQKLELGTAAADLGQDVEKLIELTREGVTDLRGYVRGLKGGATREGSLVPAVRRFTTKFTEATGIQVHVDAPHDVQISDRLAAEVFQMVAEGLSNVRKHTQAERATVRLASDDGHLMLSIENDPTGEVKDFTPRSITERAVALGGVAYVEQPGRNATAIVVEIPL